MPNHVNGQPPAARLPVDAASDLLSVAVSKTRAKLDRGIPVQQRIKISWAAAKAARKLGSTDVVTKEFTALAVETGLMRDLGYHGREDIEHTVSWAVRGWNPFATGPLQ